MELNLEEQTLLATFRSLDELGKKELLRFAAKQHQRDAELAPSPSGQCKIEREEDRPEAVSEPIFTE